MLPLARESFARRRARLVLATTALVVGIACSGRTEGPGEIGGSLEVRSVSEAAQSACRESARALCARATECSPLHVTFFFETTSECEAVVSEACASRYSGPGASAAPKECVAEARAAPCELLTSPAEALSVFESAATVLLRACPVEPGRFGDHDACLRDGDCASGACGELRPGGGCNGCIPRRRIGEPCAPGIACVSPARCVGGLCNTPLPDGAECADAEACASRACVEGRCTTWLGDGASCTVDGVPPCDLARALVCVEDEQRCRALSIVEPGDACDPFPSAVPRAVIRLCDARATCEEGRCVALPRRGEACTTRCRLGLTCRGGRCEPSFARTATSCAR